MTNLKIDSFGNLYDCESDDVTIVISKEVKNVKSFAFVDLPVKRIVFESEEISFEDNSFVNLENLEVIDVKDVKRVESLFFFEDALSDTPLDVCLFVGRRIFVDEILKHSTYINVFFIDDVYDPDNGYKPSWGFCPFCLTQKEDYYLNPTTGEKMGAVLKNEWLIDSCNYSFSIDWSERLGLYIPDTFDGKRLEIQTFTVLEGIFNVFENIRCLKLPKLSLIGYTCNNYPLTLKRIHLSRLDRIIPASFFNKSEITSLYIPKNIKELRGFYNAYLIENLTLQDSSNISYVDSFFLENSKFFTNLESKQKKFSNILIWNDFALKLIGDVKGFLIIPNNVRIIADGFSRGASFLSIELGANVERICDSAFEEQSKLCKIEFNNKLNYIGDRAFYSNFLSILEIPDNVKYIGKEAFKVRFYEDEPVFERKILSYPKDAKLGEKCFDIEEVSLPFN